MDHRPSIELLEAHHVFPGVYQIKAIGAGVDFEARALAAVVAELGAASDLDHSARTTPGGRHVALTLHIRAQSAEQVRAVYGRLHQVEGLTLLL